MVACFTQGSPHLEVDKYIYIYMEDTQSGQRSAHPILYTVSHLCHTSVQCTLHISLVPGAGPGFDLFTFVLLLFLSPFVCRVGGMGREVILSN